jgi:serine/threonine protein kinase
MAPEQVHGEVLTTATDVWALGAVLFELATGHFACHDGEESTSSSEPGDLSLCVPVPVRTWRRLPRPLGSLIDRCLTDRPEDRPVLTEVHAELDLFLGGAVGATTS